MSKKQDYILDYIKKLETGSKVSIRTLADTLLVSEGTAYKAIKKAEELGLVHTKPRAGTVRIASNTSDKSEFLTLKNIIIQLGLTEITPVDSDVFISSIIVGDGSCEQLSRDFKRTSGNKLCVVGDRPDIQHKALSLGMHLLITGATEIHQDIIDTAFREKKYILSSNQSSQNILFLLYNTEGYKHPSASMNTVADWTHHSDYLYYNDIYADWYRVYSPILSLTDKYAVVDDNLSICGMLNSTSMLNASPENRISDLYSSDINCEQSCVNPDISMDELAKKMITENTCIIYTEENDKLKGYITAIDILRYYYHTNTEGALQENFPIELIYSSQDQSAHEYQITLPSQNVPLSSEQLFQLSVAVSKNHLEQLYSTANYKITGVTFYTLDKKQAISDLQARSLIFNSDTNSCMIEIEIHMNSIQVFKCIFTYTINQNI